MPGLDINCSDIAKRPSPKPRLLILLKSTSSVFKPDKRLTRGLKPKADVVVSAAALLPALSVLSLRSSLFSFCCFLAWSTLFQSILDICGFKTKSRSASRCVATFNKSRLGVSESTKPASTNLPLGVCSLLNVFNSPVRALRPRSQISC